MWQVSNLDDKVLAIDAIPNRALKTNLVKRSYWIANGFLKLSMLGNYPHKKEFLKMTTLDLDKINKKKLAKIVTQQNFIIFWISHVLTKS